MLSRLEAEALKPEEKLRQAVDVTTPAHLIAAGFDVNFVGSDQDLHVAGAAGGARGAVGAAAAADDAGDGNGEGEGPVLGRDEALYVDEETFCLWLDSNEFSFGRSLQCW